MTTAPWDAHGPLRVSANGHYLEHEDGAGFFWLGDTAWRLVSLGPDDVTHYLRNRADKGFTVILFVATGLGRATYDGERPFVGEGKPWPSVEFNEAYWSHVDGIIGEAKRLGLYVALLAWWGPDADSMFADPHTHNFEYGQALAERYADQPNIIWVGSGEYHKPFMWEPLSEVHTSNLVRLVEGIRSVDRARHLLTMHPLSFLSSSEEFHDEAWLDFNMVQTHVYHDYIDHLVYGDWERTPAKPTVNAEPWYEGEEELFERRTGVLKVPPRDGRKFDTAWIQRYQAYWSVFFGGIGYTYGHMNLWMMSDIYELYTHANWGTPGVLLQSALDAPGSAHLAHLRGFAGEQAYPVADTGPVAAVVEYARFGRRAVARFALRDAGRGRRLGDGIQHERVAGARAHAPAGARAGTRVLVRSAHGHVARRRGRARRKDALRREHSQRARCAGPSLQPARRMGGGQRLGVAVGGRIGGSPVRAAQVTDEYYYGRRP